MLELEERLIIIKSSDLEDVTILDENYINLLADSDNEEDQLQLTILHINAAQRIKDLNTN
jgi:hypothetical protein